MTLRKIDISSFKKDRSFYGTMRLLITVKSFNLKKIRRRYLLSKKEKSGRIGSVQRRQMVKGAIVEFIVRDGSISSDILLELTEPRGISANDDYICMSSENKVFVISSRDVQIIENKWFSYIHGLDLGDDHNLILSSSGLDTVFEYDLLSQQQSFEWCAWEHGFNKGHDPITGKNIILTRNVDRYKELQQHTTDVLLINDPLKDTLPTANRAAFINSVAYIPHTNSFLATFFHEGSVYEIDKSTSKAKKRITGLHSPHGGRWHKGKLVVSSTTEGALVIGDNYYLTTALPEKAEGLSGMEWIQNVGISEDIYVLIDSNRNALIILNPVKSLYDMVHYNENWAVQDMAFINEKNKSVNHIRDIGA